MSVLDQLRAIEQNVEKRLRELAPLVAEYRDLEKVAERLGLRRDEPQAADTAAAKPPAAPKRKAKAKPSRSRTRPTGAAKPRAPKRAAKASASADASTAAPSAPSDSAAAAAKPKPKATSGGKTASRSRRSAAAPGQREQDVLRLVSERPGITVAELARELSVDATGLYGVVRRLQAKGKITKDGTALRPITETPSTPPATTPPEQPSAAPPPTPDSPSEEPPATGS